MNPFAQNDKATNIFVQKNLKKLMRYENDSLIKKLNSQTVHMINSIVILHDNEIICARVFFFLAVICEYYCKKI